MLSRRTVLIARSMTRSAIASSACTQQYLSKFLAPLTVTRGFSVNLVNMVDPSRVASFEDVTKYSKHSDKFIIDVRNQEEVSQTGRIPSSINIPLGHVEQVLKAMTDEQFRYYYNRNKPQPSSEIVFYCRSGNRSSQALDIALSLGFSNCKTYTGSWEEWSNKTGKK